MEAPSDSGVQSDYIIGAAVTQEVALTLSMKMAKLSRQQRGFFAIDGFENKQGTGIRSSSSAVPVPCQTLNTGATSGS
ncbi:MAG: hypothetical protein JJD96_03700 [Thermoleophilia bacterium]|nr:hypothetical protein [Thermoleophilia bacterium]